MSTDKNINKLTSGKKILIAPLDWGLGHVIRCIPLIETLIKQDNHVYIAVNKTGKAVIKNHLPDFPDDRLLFLPGYEIKYPKKGIFFLFRIALQIPKILFAVRKEHFILKAWMQNYAFDWIISDNRLGFSHKLAYNIFITHQLDIQTGYSLTNSLTRKVNHHFIHQFQECWIPDYKGEKNLSGKLSHPFKKPVTPLFYIGPISRMQPGLFNKRFDICVILSGPEPQRTILEMKLLEILSATTYQVILIRGLTHEKNIPNSTSENIRIVNFANTQQLSEYVQSSDLVISRSGYTSIMEWSALHKKAVMIPTPGQTEQEYLAKHLEVHPGFLFIDQNKLDRETLEKAIGQLMNHPHSK